MELDKNTNESIYLCFEINLLFLPFTIAVGIVLVHILPNSFYDVMQMEFKRGIPTY